MKVGNYMREIISESDLIYQLEQFRHILFYYDYSEVNNIVFFDVQSLNCYLESHKDNPFERQYQALETILDIILPYLPNNLTDQAMDTIVHFLDRESGNEVAIKENIVKNIKLEFIQIVKSLRTENEWHYLINICKKIRDTKANVILTH